MSHKTNPLIATLHELSPSPELRLAREISDARDALGRENDRLKAERDRAMKSLRRMVDMFEAVSTGIPWGKTFNIDFKEMNDAECEARALLKEMENA